MDLQICVLIRLIYLIMIYKKNVIITILIRKKVTKQTHDQIINNYWKGFLWYSFKVEVSVISGNFSIKLSKSNHVSGENILAFALILQQSFLGTLLNTPLLQEKLAENINKVVGRWELLFINQTRQF